MIKDYGINSLKITEGCLRDIKALKDMAVRSNAALIRLDLNFRKPKAKLALAIVKPEGFFWYLGHHYRLNKKGKAISLHLVRKRDIRFFHERMKLVKSKKISC